MKHVPNFITSLNLASGFIAIVFAANGELVTASWLILAAMIFDFLDGLSARLLKSYSEIGKELDSLADVVSFGVAPAFIIYQLISSSLSVTVPLFTNGLVIKALIIQLIPVIMPVCAGLRLAKFNTDTSQTTSFRGLPTPANALAVISLVIADHYTGSTIYDWFSGSPTALIIFTVILSLLMISRLPLLSLKFANLKFSGNEGRFILVAMVIVSLIVLGLGAAPLIIPFYLIASFLSLLF
ncbi:MAG: CDP-diacylglycerol--serine O-phosphatidyltransferase [Bacteroidales bacterium]|nr:CDP-diacylglycerol--serine O-phosphatidyltransferase [Bacteroidales bacterium]